MQLVTLPTLALLILSHFFSNVNANSNYAATCNSLQIIDPDSHHRTILVANCEETSGIFNVATEISLALCFANANGILVGRINGGFDASCSSIGFSGTVLSATCSSTTGASVRSSIDTNDFIGNLNGDLFCFNIDGA